MYADLQERLSRHLMLCWEGEAYASEKGYVVDASPCL